MVACYQAPLPLRITDIIISLSLPLPSSSLWAGVCAPISIWVTYALDYDFSSVVLRMGDIKKLYPILSPSLFSHSIFITFFPLFSSLQNHDDDDDFFAYFL